MSPGHDHDHDHDHDHEHGHDHDHAQGPEAEPKFDPTKYEGLDGWEIRSVSDCEHELVASLPRARFDAMTETAAKSVARKVTIKGFRTGKVPVSRVKQMFGQDIHREAVEKLVNETWETAIREKNLRPIASPKITELSLKDGEPVRFTASFEMLPMVPVQGLDSIAVTPKTVKVSDADMDAEVQNIRLMRAKFVPSEATEASAGDFTVVNLMRWAPGGGREGEPAETREALVVEVGNERNLPDLDKALLGMQIGEMRDFESEIQTGGEPPTASAAFRVMLKEIRRRQLPELDVELIGSLGIGTFESVEAFKAEVRRRLVEHRTEMARREQEAEAMDHLMRQNEFGIPPSLIESEADARLRRGVENLVRRGVDVENAAINWASEMQRVRETAEKDLKADWLLELAAREKGVEVSEEDVDKEIEAIAREREEPPRAVRAALEKSKEISNLRASLRRRRTLDLLRSGATIQVE